MHTMMRSRLQSSPGFVATLIVGADSVGVACEYQTFIVEKTIADKISHVTPTESVRLLYDFATNAQLLRS